MLARDNPFATDRVEQILTFNPAWTGHTWIDLDQQWQRLGQRATITGKHGAGKTCFLDAWSDRVKNNLSTPVLRLFLNQEKKNFSHHEWQSLTHCQGKTIILDGEEQLGLRARNKFYRLTQNASGLLVTRHTPGKLPTLAHLDPDIRILHSCIKKLAPDHYAQLSPQLPTLWKNHHANIRHILLECYDQIT